MAVSDGWPVVAAKFWMNLAIFQLGIVAFCYGIGSFMRAVRGGAGQAGIGTDEPLASGCYCLTTAVRGMPDAQQRSHIAVHGADGYGAPNAVAQHVVSQSSAAARQASKPLSEGPPMLRTNSSPKSTRDM